MCTGAKADINIPEYMGTTPLDKAEQYSQIAVVDLLRQHGGKIECITEEHTLILVLEWVIEENTLIHSRLMLECIPVTEENTLIL